MPSHLQGAYEYYHLRYGGMSSYHLVGPDQSVAYLDPSMQGSRPDVHPYGLNWLDQYDGVLLVSLPGQLVTQDMIAALTIRSFALKVPPPFALLLKGGRGPGRAPTARSGLRTCSGRRL